MPGLPRLGRYCRRPQCRAIRATGLWVIDASIMPTVVRPTRTLTTIMIAEKLADEIRREAKAGSVEHSALNSRLGANVCIWHFCEVPTGSGNVCCRG